VSESTFTPSLAHSLAHAINTSSGAGFRGRSPNSALHPRGFCTQFCPLLLPAVAPLSSHTWRKRWEGLVGSF
jgi:hypothetical protein